MSAVELVDDAAAAAEPQALGSVQSAQAITILSPMTFDVTEFEIKGHRKIIEHYRRLLENDAALPAKTRDMLIVRITEAERQIRLLEQKSKTGW